MSYTKDLTSIRFGKLVALENTKAKKKTYYIWRCICDCGNEILVPSGLLTRGKVKSCGCLLKKDLKNKKFGRLKVIDKIENKRIRNEQVWKCQCDCGNIIETKTSLLTNGSVKSCGCLSKEVAITKIRAVQKACVFNNTNITRLSDKAPKNNTSGRRGVCFIKSTKKWMAFITFQKKTYNLGTYFEIKKAIEARELAENKLFIPYLKKYSNKKSPGN